MSLTLLTVKGLGKSMGDLGRNDQEEHEPEFKESKGLLRRAFSSRRKKKRNKSASGYLSPRGSRTRSPSPSPQGLSPRGSPNRLSCNELQVPGHQFLRAVMSCPMPGCSIYDRYSKMLCMIFSSFFLLVYCHPSLYRKWVYNLFSVLFSPSVCPSVKNMFQFLLISAHSEIKS